MRDTDATARDGLTRRGFFRRALQGVALAAAVVYAPRLLERAVPIEPEFEVGSWIRAFEMQARNVRRHMAADFERQYILTTIDQEGKTITMEGIPFETIYKDEED